MDDVRKDALEYHRRGRKGKIEVITTKPCVTSRDLSLAYSPGVAQPCLEIKKRPDDAYEYTAKGNLVAVISNGTAVLGLGNIGPLAGKPVMEGKGVLFKNFADIDVFDIEVATEDPDEFVRTVALLEPTFGGVNLEDIKGPECFYIEEALQEKMSIPVFHDDQHGTAIIAAAGMLNALEIVDKKMEEVTVVINGAGAAGIACANLLLSLGLAKENLTLCDSRGVIYRGREKGMNPYKERLACDTSLRTLEEAIKGADVFFGVSIKGALTPEMLATMADNPIVFAMANPDPEILPPEAYAVRDDVIIGTGRSDYDNQVNNVLCFPFLFRGALDTHASAINEEMKMAAVWALAHLARQDVPDSVRKAYSGASMRFGRRYLIPKPFDPRVLLHVAPAVAKAAMDSGVARTPIDDMAAYVESLEALQGRSKAVMRTLVNKARSHPKRVVMPEGCHGKIIRAAHILVEEGIGRPVLLGDEAVIEKRARELGLALDGVERVNPSTSSHLEAYGKALFEKRQRKGVTRADARRLLTRDFNSFGAMMVEMGDADTMLSGIDHSYPDTIRPALQIIGKEKGLSKVHGMYMLVFPKEAVFISDATVTIDPTAEELAETTLLAARQVRLFDMEPKVAMLSFSNFGSSNHPLALKVKRATELVKAMEPKLVVDGEVQANVARSPRIMADQYPFSALKGDANLFIFPDLQSANISYKLLHKLGGAELVGPILMGMNKPVHVLQRGYEVAEIVNMAAVAVVDAQR